MLSASTCPHPGELIRRDVVPLLRKRGITLTAFADRLSMSRQNLGQLLSGKQAMTPRIALRLARLVTGEPRHAETWMRLQVRHDLAAAEAAIAGELEATPVLIPASEQLVGIHHGSAALAA